VTGASDLALLGRVMGGLIIVIVLIGLIAKVARQTRGHKGDSGLRIVDRVGLSREANLAVVEVSNRMLLLGVTAQGVTMLANLDQNADPEPTAELDQDTELDQDDAGTGAHSVFNSDQETYETYDADPATADLYDVTPYPVGEYDAVEAGPGQYDDEYHTQPTAPDQVDLSQVELDVSDTIDGLTVIRAGHPTEWVEPTEPMQPMQPLQPVPAEVALDDYPDLATALRAAGRVVDPAPELAFEESWDEAEAPEDRYPNNAYLDELDELDDDDFYSDEDLSAAEPIAPRTRAEARAQERPAARSWNPMPRNRSVTPAAEVEEPTRIQVPAPAKSPAKPKKARKVVVSSTQQASGSVLSPNTWRQGLEALRELTVRRG
jgi:flagellar biogenesis protein FliO